MTMSTNTTPELAPLAPGRWRISQRRRRELQAYLDALMVERNRLGDLAEARRMTPDDLARWGDLLPEIDQTESRLRRQYWDLRKREARARKSRR